MGSNDVLQHLSTICFCLGFQKKCLVFCPRSSWKLKRTILVRGLPPSTPPLAAPAAAVGLSRPRRRDTGCSFAARELQGAQQELPDSFLQHSFFCGGNYHVALAKEGVPQKVSRGRADAGEACRRPFSFHAHSLRSLSNYEGQRHRALSLRVNEPQSHNRNLAMQILVGKRLQSG